MIPLIKPKSIKLKNLDGEDREFTISRFPSTVCREVMAKYPLSNLPKLGEYKASEEAMLLLMSYVTVVREDREIRLSTKDLVDNHVDDGILLTRIEIQMIEYNTGFFGLGGNQGFLDCLIAKFSQSITPMLTRFLAQYSQADSVSPGQNSKPQ